MQLDLDDTEKTLIVNLIDPVMTTLTTAILYRNEVEPNDTVIEEVTDTVCDFVCEYYSKG